MPDVGRITSRENQLIKEAALLKASARRRAEQSLFIAEGLRLCADAVRSGIIVRRLFFTPGFSQSHPDELGYILDASESAYETMPHALEKLADTQSPQGVVCVCEMPREPEDFGRVLTPGNAVLALEDVRDPGNLGSAARTAEALGFSALVLSAGGCSPYNPKALRASMGAFFRIPVKTAANMPDFIRSCGQINTFASVVDADALPVTRADFSKGGVLLIGSEGQGLTKETVGACSHRITIPMAGRAQSLSASAAAAIMMWQLTINN